MISGLIPNLLFQGFQLPTVMDIKVGKQTWGPDASEAKRVGEAAKYVGTKEPFGFRLVTVKLILKPLKKVQDIPFF